MELDLKQFFRDLLRKHFVIPFGSPGGPLNEKEFERLVEALVEHAIDFRKMP